MAIAYGMTQEQYFYQDPELFYIYKRSFEMKQNLNANEAWTIGAYFKKALESTPLWVYGLVKSNDFKLQEFPKPPNSHTDNNKIQSEEELNSERFRAFAYFEQIHKSNLKRQGDKNGRTNS